MFSFKAPRLTTPSFKLPSFGRGRGAAKGGDAADGDGELEYSQDELDEMADDAQRARAADADDDAAFFAREAPRVDVVFSELGAAAAARGVAGAGVPTTAFDVPLTATVRGLKVRQTL